jgi:imidazolonepropionase-like amidohydrolase
MKQYAPEEASGVNALLAVRADQLFDGEDSFGPSTVVCEGSQIVDVDATGGPPPPAHTDVVDLGDGAWILPGLIDAHVQLVFDASADVRASIQAAADELHR